MIPLYKQLDRLLLPRLLLLSRRHPKHPDLGSRVWLEGQDCFSIEKCQIMVSTNYFEKMRGDAPPGVRHKTLDYLLGVCHTNSELSNAGTGVV